MNGLGFWDNPFDPMRELCIEVPNTLKIPLYTKGTKIVFDTHLPSEYELNNCPHVELTSIKEWNPQKVVLGKVQSQGASERYPVVVSKVRVYPTLSSSHSIVKNKYLDPTADHSILHQIDPLHVCLKELLIGAMHTNFDDLPARRTYVSDKRHNKLSAESISELWCIGLKRAQATIDATTQTGVRSAILPLSRRYLRIGGITSKG